MARRKTEVFSMSFLDCITCAFGSVVLVYVLISAQAACARSAKPGAARRSFEARRAGARGLSASGAAAQLDDSDRDEQVKTEGLGTRVLSETERLKVEMADSDKKHCRGARQSSA
jgi:hypothetical protein